MSSVPRTSEPATSFAETLSRILRSASFRLTLFYAVLFMASAGTLFAAVY